MSPIATPGQDHPLLQHLNPAQKAIVSAPDTNLMVLAGAGSGKTRVLIHRIAWLNTVYQVPASGILAVTFTNKAAGEMRKRLEAMGMGMSGAWVGTFHSTAHRLLRDHPKEAGLPETFQILDGDDQFRLIKRVMVDLEVDTDEVPPRKVMEWINQHKDEGYRAKDISASKPGDREMLPIYREYEERCRVSDLVDFAELLLRTHEMFGQHPGLLAYYRQRFAHILVDEFQDTNNLQYAIIQRLAGPDGKVLAVGDDSQSIYGWRGAKVGNVKRFVEEFPNATLMRLEQNYRSFRGVLAAANALIGNNASQIPKKLWTARQDDEPIRVHTAIDEQDEARYVVNAIHQHVRLGGQMEDCAILYRSNAQSRPFEEALLAQRIPYKITGGQRFFERAEIKDAMAYLRLSVARNDDTAFERVANTPTRGMGEKTMELIRARARTERQSAWDASHGLLSEGALPKRAATALRGFLQTVEATEAAMAAVAEKGELGDQIKAMLDTTALPAHHGKEGKGEVDKNRVENLNELVSVATRFKPLEGASAHPLLAFLTHAALEASEAAAGHTGPSVELMTLHAAKGLEFKRVFLVGLEEGLFPSERSATDPDPAKLEEERRLAYVGITRAEHHLTLTHAYARRLYGQMRLNPVSRFMAEIPRELLELSQSPGTPKAALGPADRPEREGPAERMASHARPLGGAPPTWGPAPVWPTAPAAPGQPAWRPGLRVAHDTHGIGLVVRLNPATEQTQVAFRSGAKWVGTRELTPA
jgi:DNA helicase-2/ATP-dependent DNA helicase PcrA